MLTRDFQVILISQLAKDEKLFKSAQGRMHVSDLDLPACRLIYEILVDYWSRYEKLPDFTNLQMHLALMMSGAVGTIKSVLLTPEEQQSLAWVMEQVYWAQPAKDDYFMGVLPTYLTTVRIAKLHSSLGSGTITAQNASSFVKEVVKIAESSAANMDIKLDSMLGNPEPMMDDTGQFLRICTGLRRLNEHLKGGLGRSQYGLITACPGVGKTTSLINFMRGAIAKGNRSLFITLELTGPRIKHRFQAIASGLDTRWFSIPVRKWPERILRRYNQILKPDYIFHDYSAIVDFSGRTATIQDVDRAIGMWMEEYTRKYGSDSHCNSVYVDWLDELSPQGLPSLNMKNDRGDEKLVALNRALAKLSKKYHVSMWSATQGNKEADGVEKLAMRHTAGAYHKADALDVGVGLGVIDEGNTGANSNTFGYGSDDDINTEPSQVAEGADINAYPACRRKLMMTLTKNRDSSTGYFDIFQGESLRFFNNPQDAREYTERLENDDFEAAEQFATQTLSRRG